MKKILFMLAFVATSMLSLGQNNQLVWANGHVLYGTPIESIDSLTYSEMQDIDTLQLLIPRSLIQVVHDTIFVHDTIYINDCDTTTEKPETPYEYVDLGLSVKWATCNLGANAPEEYGHFFTWDVEHLDADDWSGVVKPIQPKQRNIATYEKVVLDTTGNVDPAKKYLDEKWRMPTKEELEELVDNCTWEWITQNGVYGCKVISNITGYTDRSIFLPAAGVMGEKDTNIYDAEEYGYYWSSTVYKDTKQQPNRGAYYLRSYELDDKGKAKVSWTYRYRAYPIRPVCQ